MSTAHQRKIHLPISPNMKLADVIHLDYLLIPIIGRFGIELGFGNKTIAEICDQKKIHLSFFIDILNSYHNHDYFPKSQLQDYPLFLIVEYLSNTHRYYLEYKIHELEEMVANFIKSSTEEDKTNNKLIASFFEKYKIELIRHFKQEDNTLFPYTKMLEHGINSNLPTPELIFIIEHNNIVKNDNRHNELEEKLDDLKNLIIKFLPPVKRADILEKLLIELFRLENDLNDHSRIEDKVLIPKIIQLEQKILKSGDTQKA